MLNQTLTGTQNTRQIFTTLNFIFLSSKETTIGAMGKSSILEGESNLKEEIQQL